MGLIATAFVALVLLTGVPAFWKLGWVLGLCGTVSPWVAIAGGGGIAEALRGSVGKGAWVTVIIGIAIVSAALWWPSYVGWRLNLFGLIVPGWLENLVAAFFGFSWGYSKRLNPPT